MHEDRKSSGQASVEDHSTDEHEIELRNLQLFFSPKELSYSTAASLTGPDHASTENISSRKYSCNFRLLTTHNRCIILILVRGNEWLYFGLLIGILLTICLLLLPSRSVFLSSQFLSVYQFGYAGLREKQRWPKYDSVDESDVADRYIWSWF